MANIKLTDFPAIANQDWISDNILNNRGGRFVARVAKGVAPLMPVRRGNLSNPSFSVAFENDPALYICESIAVINGKTYGVITCDICTAKCTNVPANVNSTDTYTITFAGGGDDGTDPNVVATKATTGVLFRIIDADPDNHTITYIKA